MKSGSQSNPELTSTACLSSQLTLGKPPLVSSECWNYSWAAMAAGDLNSSPHSCTAAPYSLACPLILTLSIGFVAPLQGILWCDVVCRTYALYGLKSSPISLPAARFSQQVFVGLYSALGYNTVLRCGLFLYPAGRQMGQRHSQRHKASLGPVLTLRSGLVNRQGN